MKREKNNRKCSIYYRPPCWHSQDRILRVASRPSIIGIWQSWEGGEIGTFMKQPGGVKRGDFATLRRERGKTISM